MKEKTLLGDIETVGLQLGGAASPVYERDV